MRVQRGTSSSCSYGCSSCCNVFRADLQGGGRL